MATLTATPVTRAGVALAGSAATAATGDAFANTGTEFLVVKNGGASPINATIKFRGLTDGLAVTDRLVAVAAGATEIIGPFPKGAYNDGTGKVTVICDVVTSVTVQVLTCPAA
jgi:hypothetical protein